MTFFGEDGALTNEASKWAGPIVALVIALGSMAGIYAKFEADIAVEDERLKILEARELSQSIDHDLLIRMDARLGRIESAVVPGK